MPHKPFVRTLRAQWLGQHLREIREQRGMTLKMVGEFLRRDHTALSRYERAEWPIRRAEVVALLDLYEFPRAGEREHLLRLAEDVWHTDNWADGYRDIVDAAFVDFPWLESRARLICSYHATLIPGLFQTREYAELVIRKAEGARATEEKVARWVELRMRRQQALGDPDTARIAAVIDEGALRRRVGGPVVMREQLRQLAEAARRPTVEIRVLPADVCLHDGLHGSFWLFHLPDGYPMVGYLENLAGHVYVESPRSAQFLDAHQRLTDVALDPQESTKLISTIAEEL